MANSVKKAIRILGLTARLLLENGKEFEGKFSNLLNEMEKNTGK